MMSSIPRRGLYQGQWHADLNTVPDRNSDFQQSFKTPAARVEIDIDRLRQRPESYHLYAAKACPFAHRVLMMLALLPGANLGVTYCDPWLGHPQGWTFEPGATSPVGGQYLWQVYTASDPVYSGWVTVPVLWDCDARAIASAESLDIIQALATAFGPHLIPNETGFAELCDWIHDALNVGVYKVGFATTQQDYDAAIAALENTLQRVSTLVCDGYAYGDSLTLADLMIFATGIRFDAAYQGAFQILHRRWSDDPSLSAHLKRVAQLESIAVTVAIDDYRRHYFDEVGFPIRHPMDDGHYIIPITPDPFA